MEYPRLSSQASSLSLLSPCATSPTHLAMKRHLFANNPSKFCLPPDPSCEPSHYHWQMKRGLWFYPHPTPKSSWPGIPATQSSSQTCVALLDFPISLMPGVQLLACLLFRSQNISSVSPLCFHCHHCHQHRSPR